MLNLNLNRRSHVYMYAACWHVLTYLLTYSYGRCLRGSVVTHVIRQHQQQPDQSTGGSGVLAAETSSMRTQMAAIIR
jgi:hypothetical protein